MRIGKQHRPIPEFVQGFIIGGRHVTSIPPTDETSPTPSNDPITEAITVSTLPDPLEIQADENCSGYFFTIRGGGDQNTISLILPKGVPGKIFFVSVLFESGNSTKCKLDINYAPLKWILDAANTDYYFFCYKEYEYLCLNNMGIISENSPG